jgi:tetratricopeptide (TPR) repeat protein
MAREGFAALLCAGVLVLPLNFCPSLVAADENRDPALASTLAVQLALQQGREHIERGHYGAAVHVLESQLSRINGNREYLARLRDAYRGHVKELRLARRDDEAQVYLRRLEILDPGARLDFTDVKAAAATPIAAQAPAGSPLSPAATTSTVPAALAPGTPAESGTTRPPFVARGVRGEERTKPADDPFHPGNRIDNRAATLLGKAEDAWTKKEYATAGRLYEQAHQSDPGSTAACQEQWAYCKLYAVVQQLRETSGTAAYPQMEEEVRTALAMAPRLESHGKQVLARIQQQRGRSTTPAAGPAAGPMAVRHAERTADGWAIAETTHFRIYHTQPRDLVEKVATVAEQARIEVSRKWFADEGEAWDARCDLYLHATAQDYSRATGKPAAWPAHSTINLESGTGRVVSRRIDLRCDDPDLLVSSLPHETTHVVLAGRFGGPDVPRWADEGMALLSEPPDRIERHLRALAAHYQDGGLFPIRELLMLKNYPAESHRRGAFYAQSLSVTQLLVHERGPQTFARFLTEALRYGYDKALQRHYGYDVSTLEQRWRQATFGQAATQTAYGLKGR